MTHAIIQENPVSAPAFIFNALRDKLHATEYHQKNDDEILAIHWEINSLFGLSLFWSTYERYFATEMVCVNQIKAISIAKIKRFISSEKCKYFHVSLMKNKLIDGKPAGIVHIIFHW